MRNYMLFFILLLAAGLTSCSLSQPIPMGASRTPEGPPLPAAVSEQKAGWVQSLNKGKAADLQPYYWEDAGLLWGRNLFKTAGQVAEQWEYWHTALGRLVEQRTHSIVRQDNDRYLEAGYYQFSEEDPSVYVYTIAWRQVDGRWLRELEVVQPLFNQSEMPKREIDQARDLWVKRSNAHDHQALVSRSYAADGFYVNQGRFHQGAEAISEQYRYMSQPNWQIELEPISVVPVQAGLAFELGQYRSNGVGHYLIVWEKQVAQWQVLLDFNF